MRRTHSIPVEHDVESALAELAGQLSVATLRVATHLEPADVLLDIRDASEEELTGEDWLERAARQIAPAGMSPGAYRSSYRVLSIEDESLRVAVGLAPTASISQRLGLFEEAGLRPSVLGIPGLDATAACAYDTDFPETCRRLILEQGSTAQVIDVEGGVPQSVRSMSADHLVDLLADTGNAGDIGRSSVWAASCTPESTALAATQARLVQPLRGLWRTAPLSADYTLAAGLALRALYLDPEHSANASFVEPEAATEIQIQHEQAFGRRVSLQLGALVLCLLVLLTVGEMVADSRLARAEEALAPMAAVLATVEEEAARMERLRQDVFEAERRSADRTRSAAALGAVANLSPAGVQWQEVDLYVDGVKEPAIVVRGLARADTSLSVFLRSLEAADFTAGVRLAVAESVVPGSGAARDLPPGPDLRRFEIQALLPPISGARRVSSPERGGIP